MSKHKKDGFTLVELLAVIVILAVILVIAVPSIMSTIAESRKGALASSAKLIASSAETAYISNQTLGIEKNIRCEDVSNYTREDYKSCDIKFVDGKAKVTLIGQGKFEGMSVCGGTKEDAEVKNGNNCPVPAVEKIENLFKTAANANGLIEDTTTDKNIRYAGGSADVKNYVEFGNDNELWRIIGIFKVTTSSGDPEKLVKIVKDTSIGSYSWDSSTSDVNKGYGVNEWSQADLMTMLNTQYIKKENGTCYSGRNNASTSCDFRTMGIDSTYRGMIEEVVWKTGALKDEMEIDVSDAYDEERGDKIGKKCSSGDYCNDSVTRYTEWKGKIGLIYPSDYGYASTNTSCRANINDRTNDPCKNANWLHTGSYWTLSPFFARSEMDSKYASDVWLVSNGGYIGDYIAGDTTNVRPAIYLKSDVLIESGEGTQASPYQISMS